MDIQLQDSLVPPSHSARGLGLISVCTEKRSNHGIRGFGSKIIIEFNILIIFGTETDFISVIYVSICDSDITGWIRRLYLSHARARAPLSSD